MAKELKAPMKFRIKVEGEIEEVEGGILITSNLNAKPIYAPNLGQLQNRLAEVVAREIKTGSIIQDVTDEQEEN